MLERNDRQVAYYDAGVGTLSAPTAITKLQRLVSRRLDAAIGLRVRENAIAAYRFLVRTYQTGDRIYLIGFSRGAYTARAVAGMIRFLGLLRPESQELVPLAWSLYAKEGNIDTVSRRFAGGNRFNRCFGIPAKPRIHVVGVWDTVSSFGWFWDFRTLPYTANNSLINNIRHALAIDERRACFPANLFFPDDDQRPACKQVWFAGVHSDVGGGYPEKESTLAKVSLAWMLRELQPLGLLIDRKQHDYLMHSRTKPPLDPSGALHDSLTGFWKPFESLPRCSWNDQDKRMRWLRPHRGRRHPIAPGSSIHVSVRERMSKLRYVPKNLPTEVIWEE